MDEMEGVQEGQIQEVEEEHKHLKQREEVEEDHRKRKKRQEVVVGHKHSRVLQ